jgi:hypothetical protein
MRRYLYNVCLHCADADKSSVFLATVVVSSIAAAQHLIRLLAEPVPFVCFLLYLFQLCCYPQQLQARDAATVNTVTISDLFARCTFF